MNTPILIPKTDKERIKLFFAFYDLSMEEENERRRLCCPAAYNIKSRTSYFEEPEKIVHEAGQLILAYPDDFAAIKITGLDTVLSARLRRGMDRIIEKALAELNGEKKNYELIHPGQDEFRPDGYRVKNEEFRI